MASFSYHNGLILQNAKIYYLFWGHYWQQAHDDAHAGSGFTGNGPPNENFPMLLCMSYFRQINQCSEYINPILRVYLPTVENCLLVNTRHVCQGKRGLPLPVYQQFNIQRETLLNYFEDEQTSQAVKSVLEPPQEVRVEDVKNFIYTMINNGGCPDERNDPQHLYFVILPPFRWDGTSNEENLPIEFDQSELGANTTGFHWGDEPTGQPMLHFACIMTRNRERTTSPTGLDINSITGVYSHEFVEEITNPKGTGIKSDNPSSDCPTATGDCELADMCQTSQTLRTGIQPPESQCPMSGQNPNLILEGWWDQSLNACSSGDLRLPCLQPGSPDPNNQNSWLSVVFHPSAEQKMRNDIAELKSDIRSIKSDITEIKSMLKK